MTTRKYRVEFEISGLEQLRQAFREVDERAERLREQFRGAFEDVPSISDEGNLPPGVGRDRVSGRFVSRQQVDFRGLDRAFVGGLDKLRSSLGGLTRAIDQNIDAYKESQKPFDERKQFKALPGKEQLLIREFRAALSDQVNSIQGGKTEDTVKDFVTGSVKGLADLVMFPIQGTLFGVFEEVGRSLVADLMSGFTGQLQKSVGLDFSEVGADVGRVVGDEIFKGYEESLKLLHRQVSGQEVKIGDVILDSIGRIFQSVSVQVPAIALKAHRRVQLNKYGIPQAEILAGQKMGETIPGGIREEIERNRSITLAVGGQNTDPSDIGKDYTARLLREYLKGSAVIPIQRQWTNQGISDDFSHQLDSVMDLVLSNDLAKNQFYKFLQQAGLGDLGAKEKELLSTKVGDLDLSQKEGLKQAFMGLLKDQDFSLGKALEATFKGFNPDDVLIAAEAIRYMKQFPDKELQIAGWSQGGYQAAGAVDLLNRMGYKNVKGIGIGTPLSGLNYTGDPQNFRAFAGKEDFYYKIGMGMMKDFVPPHEVLQTAPGEGRMHSLPVYLGKENSQFKALIRSFLGDRVDPVADEDFRASAEGAYLYSVGELGAETAIARTLLKYLGESQFGGIDAQQGFIFSAEESLPGYAGNLAKRSKKLKNPDVKKFAQDYQLFLETFQQELELIEKLAQVGVKHKPVQSLQKAVQFFPQLESLAEKHTEGLSDNELQAGKRLTEEHSSLVFFKRKMAQQKSNIEHTLQAMMGRRFTADDEKKGMYSFFHRNDYRDRADNALGPMIDWLENTVLGDVGTDQKQQVQPFLDFLKRLKAGIVTAGDQGVVDVELLRQAKDLFGVGFGQYEKVAAGLMGSGKVSTPKPVVPLVDQPLKGFEEQYKRYVAEAKAAKSPSLLEAYRQYLDGLVNAASEQAAKQIRVMAGNYDELSLTERKGKAEEFIKEIADDVKKFRDAVRDNDLETARELGELILKRSQAVDKIYAELQGQVTNQASLKQFQARRGQLKAIQTEVRRGQPNQVKQGRVAIGVEQMIEELENAAQAGDSTAQNIVAGFRRDLIQGMEDLGIDAGEAFKQANEDSLGIASPSRWAVGIAQFIMQGLETILKPARELGEGIKESLAGGMEGIDGVVQQSGVGNSIDQGFAAMIESVTDFFDAIEKRFPILSRLKKFGAEAAGVIVGGFAALAGLDFFSKVTGLDEFVAGIVSFPEQSIEAAKSLESLDVAFESVAGSADKGAEGMAFATRTAKNLGTELRQTREAYAEFQAATRFTSLEGFQSEQIFSAFQETAALRGLSTAQQGNLNRAINQIVSKGKFQAEEVRGQLGEIPALAFQQTLARALGLDGSQLEQALRDEVGIEALSQVAALYAAENSALGSRGDTLQTLENRRDNSFLQAQERFGQQFEGFQKSGLKVQTALVEKLTKNLELLLTSAAAASAVFGIDLVRSLLTSATAAQVFRSSSIATINALKAALPVVLKFLAKTALIYGVFEVGKNLFFPENTYKELENQLEGLEQGLKNLGNAFRETGDQAQRFYSNQPRLNEGIQVPDWVMPLLEVQNTLSADRGLKRYFVDQNAQGEQVFNLEGVRRHFISDLTFGLIKPGETLAEQRQDQLFGFGDQIDRAAVATMREKGGAVEAVREILRIEQEINALRLERSQLPLGHDRYDELREQETKLQEEADEARRKIAAFQSSLTQTIEAQRSQLQEIDQGLASGRIARIPVNFQKRQQRFDRLTFLEEQLKGFEEEVSALPRSLSATEFAMRRLRLQTAQRLEDIERQGVTDRTRILQQALGGGRGQQVIQLDLEVINQRALKARAKELEQKLQGIDRELQEPKFTQPLQALRDQFEPQGLDVETNSKLQEELLAKEDGLSDAQRDALELLQKRIERNDELNQLGEQIVQEELQVTNSVRDMHNSVRQFFFNLESQAKESALQLEQAKADLRGLELSQILKRSLVPGSQSFVNGMVEQINSLLGEGQRIIQDIFGQQGARLQLERDRFDLNTQMEDFTHGLAGATDALRGFTAAVGSREQGSISNSVTGFTGNNAIQLPEIRVEGETLVGITGNTGIGTGAHLDIRKRDRDRRLTNAELDRFLVDGKPLTEYPITSEFGPRRAPVPGASTFHAGVDFGIGVGGRITTQVPVKSVNIREPSQTGGGGYVTDVLFADGLEVSLLHQSPEILDAGIGSTIGQPSVSVPSQPRATNGLDPKVKAFLDMIAYAEGADYDVQFSGRRFSDFSDHPREVIRAGGYASDASGRYQFLSTTWDGVARQLGLTDFSPENQDQGAVELLRRRGALDNVLAGDIRGAIFASAPEWASLPTQSGESYYGQPVRRLNELLTVYERSLQQALTQPAQGGSGLGLVDSYASRFTDGTGQGQLLQNEILGNREAAIGVQAERTLVESQAYFESLKNQEQAIVRQFTDQMRQSSRTLEDLATQVEDFQVQHGPQDLETQIEQQNRSLEQSVTQLTRSTEDQAIALKDTIDSSRGAAAGMREVIEARRQEIERLRSTGQEQDRLEAEIREGELATSEALLRSFEEQAQAYEEQLQQLEEIEGAFLGAADGARAFREQMAEILRENERLKQEEIASGIALEIAERTRNLAEQEAIAITQIVTQIQQSLNDLRQQFPNDSEFLNRLEQDYATLEQLRVRDARFDAKQRELDQLGIQFDLQNRIAQAEAQLLQSDGRDIRANAVLRENALLQENLRFRREILRIEREAPPELVKTLIADAQRLNALNLENIKNQFKGLGQTILDNVKPAVEGFFTDIFTNAKSFGDALRDLARNILTSFAQMAARNLTNSLFRSLGGIFGGGSSSGGSFGGGIGGFAGGLVASFFRHGGTVPNYESGGRVVPDRLTQVLRAVSPSITEAFQREGTGSRARLGVFTIGEQILSTQSGEAGRYRTLEGMLGVDPLKQVLAGHFVNGGEIGFDWDEHLRSQFVRTPEFKIDFDEIQSRPRTSQRPITTNTTINVSATDLNSFNKSKGQILAEMEEEQRRSTRRNRG